MIPDSRVHLRPSFIWDANLRATHMHTVTAGAWSPLTAHHNTGRSRFPALSRSNVSVWSLFDSNFPSANQWLNYTSSGPKQKQTKENKADWLRQNVQCEVSELQVNFSVFISACYFSSTKLCQSFLVYLWRPLPRRCGNIWLMNKDASFPLYRLKLWNTIDLCF